VRDNGRHCRSDVRDLTAMTAIRAGQDDPAPQRQRLRARMPARPPLQRRGSPPLRTTRLRTTTRTHRCLHRYGNDRKRDSPDENSYEL